MNDLLGLASLLAYDGPNSVKYLLKVLAIIIWFDCLWPFTDISNMLKWLFSFLESSTESSSYYSEDWSDEESGKLGTEITGKTF